MKNTLIALCMLGSLPALAGETAHKWAILKSEDVLAEIKERGPVTGIFRNNTIDPTRTCYDIFFAFEKKKDLQIFACIGSTVKIKKNGTIKTLVHAQFGSYQRPNLKH